MKKLSKNGFTLVEIVFVVGILSFVIISLIQVLIYTSTQAEMAGNKTAAVMEAQNKIEEIRNHAYSQIVTDYGSGGTPGNTFALTLLNGMGIIYIDSSNSGLLVIEVVISWQNKYNRIVGEDSDLDGVLDTGEDINSNSKFDSPVELVTFLTSR